MIIGDTHRDKCVMNSSLAHTVGNVTYKFTNYLKNLLGKDYFKYVHINTRMAFTEFRKFNNSHHEIIRKNKPILAINPSIDVSNNDIFLKYSLLTTNMYGESFKNTDSFNFLPFFGDMEVGNRINYLMNRIRVGFGVSMLFDTEIEQINVYGMLNNYFCEDQPYYYPTALEVFIPKNLMELISMESGIPIYDDNGSVSKFLKYVNMHTNRPVIFKEKCATTSEEFFMYYPLRIEYFITDISRGDVSKKGFISSTAEISFTLTTEFNTVGMYEYVPAKKSDVLKKYNTSVEINYVNQQLIIPYYTVDNMFDCKNEDGWKFFTCRMFKIEMDDGSPETLDISDIFESTNIKEMIDYHNTHSIPHEIFFDLKLLMGDKYLEYNKDYKFDFETLTMTINKVNNKQTYRFIIYINNEYINETFNRINEGDLKYD